VIRNVTLMLKGQRHEKELMRTLKVEWTTVYFSYDLFECFGSIRPFICWYEVV